MLHKLDTAPYIQGTIKLLGENWGLCYIPYNWIAVYKGE